MEKIQELTEKIYREGVEKGNAEAQRLIQDAQEQAAQIIADAKTQAETIVAKARKTGCELDANTKSELKLYAGQALNALKSEIVNIVSDKVVSEAVTELVANKEFLAKFMITIAENWSSDESMVISTSDAENLKKYFAIHSKASLDNEIKIEKVNGKEALFTISPQSGSYKVKFGEQEFENYFKEFLRPQLIEMLF